MKSLLLGSLGAALVVSGGFLVPGQGRTFGPSSVVQDPISVPSAPDRARLVRSTESPADLTPAAAEIWLAAHPDDNIRDMRFDAMLVAPGRLPQHIPAAFDASG